MAYHYGIEVHKENKHAFPKINIHRFKSRADRSKWMDAENSEYRCGLYAEHHWIGQTERMGRMIEHH